MVNVSKKYLDENFRKSLWRDFISEFKKVKTEKEAEKIIDRIFTLSEKVMIEKRLGIFALLKRGLSYREISRLLDVMPATVYFVKRGFTNKPLNPRPRTPRGQNKRKYSASRFPTYTGKGRWRFLDAY